MDKVTFSRRHQDYIDEYDGHDYKIWNTTKGMVAKIRVAIREHYKIQQSYMCCYCRQQNIQEHGYVWDCEHILPKAIYPKFLFEPFNLALSCKACNLAKEKYKEQIIINSKDRYCTDKYNYRIIHPHFDVYSEHLKVKVRRGTTVHEIVTTTKGAFTYKCCGLDRFDKKLAGYDNINASIAKTISKYVDAGMSNDELVAALLAQDIDIEKVTDF